MGLFRFLVEPKSLLKDEASLRRGYLVGADGRIQPASIETNSAGLEIHRPSSESARLNLPWDIEGIGRRMVSTAALPQREVPYLLPLELARGKIVQFRNQCAAWSMAGMKIPESAEKIAREAYRDFSNAAGKQEQPHLACELSHSALRKAFLAADELTASYAAQSMSGRRQKYPHVPIAFGCELPGTALTGDLAERFLLAFGSASIDFSWPRLESTEGELCWDDIDTQLEWAEKHRLIVRGGPLIDLGPNGMPSWVTRWADDFYNLQSILSGFVESAIGQYGGRIRQWEIISHANSGGALALNEETRMALAVQLLEIARQADEEAMFSIRVDQPWGDYLARGQHRLAPLQMVDAIVRSGVALSGINLDISVGFLPRGSVCRDLMEVSRLIDSWSVLGVPLTITLACPSQSAHDPHADPNLEIESEIWSEGCSEATQVTWLNEVIPLAMAKHSVVAVYWTHFLDSCRHEFPNAGLIRNDLTAKPSFDRVYELRQATV